MRNCSVMSSRMCLQIVTAFAVWGCSAHLCLALQPDGAAAKTEFLQDYERHAPELQDYYSQFRATMRGFPGGKEATQTTAVSTMSGVNSGTSSRFDSHIEILEPGKSPSPDGGKLTVTHVRNSQYAFDVQHQQGGQPTPENIAVYATGASDSLCLLLFPVFDTVRRKSILEIANDNDTEIVSYRETTWHGMDVQALTTQYDWRNPQTQEASPLKITYYLDPKQAWVCVGRLSVGTEDGITTEIEEFYEYAESDSAPFPTPLRITQTMRDSTGSPATNRQLSATDVLQYDHLDQPLPDSEFRLTAFGFPEPGGIHWDEPVSAWIWIAYAGGGLLLLGVAFWMLKRKVARKASDET